MGGPPAKRLRLAYGRSGLGVDVPTDADVLEPQQLKGVLDEAAVIRRALRDPIASEPLRRGGPRGAAVGVSVCDVTRPLPARRAPPVVLGELEPLPPAGGAGFVSPGPHRRRTPRGVPRRLGEA